MCNSVSKASEEVDGCKEVFESLPQSRHYSDTKEASLLLWHVVNRLPQ